MGLPEALDKMRRFGYGEAELMVGVINDSFRQRYQMKVKGVEGV